MKYKCSRFGVVGVRSSSGVYSVPSEYGGTDRGKYCTCLCSTAVTFLFYKRDVFCLFFYILRIHNLARFRIILILISIIITILFVLYYHHPSLNYSVIFSIYYLFLFLFLFFRQFSKWN
jgi:hypothetical protein